MIDIQEVDDAVRVAIADNGIGMSEKTKRHIFEQFYQVNILMCKKEWCLAIVKTIVERLDGTISRE